MYRRLIDVMDSSRHRFPDLRLAITGSASMPVELHRLCRDVFGQTILERYGMTETLMNSSNPLDGQRKPGSVGLPLPSVEIRLLDENLKPIHQPDQPGEVLIRGPNVFSGYWGDADATQRAFFQDWFRSGDIARRDMDGYYYLLGRASLDLIKSGGYRIGAREVEEVLERHPAVREAAVLGLPDEDLGERGRGFRGSRLSSGRTATAGLLPAASGPLQMPPLPGLSGCPSQKSYGKDYEKSPQVLGDTG